MNHNQLPIIHVVENYPHRSQTFIVQEFKYLIDQGINVWMLATNGINSALLDEWPDAQATMPRVIAGTFSSRERFEIPKRIQALFRIIITGHWKSWWMDSKHLKGKTWRTTLFGYSAFARIPNASIVHFHFSGGASNLLKLNIPILLKTRIFVSFRGKDLTTIPINNLESRCKIFREKDVTCLPVSNALAQLLLVHGKLPKERVHIHYSGFDTNFFLPTPEEQEFRFTEPTMQLYFAGRFTDKKGPLETLDLFFKLEQVLSKKDISIKLLMAGDGPLKTQVEQRVIQSASKSVFLQSAFTPEEHRVNLIKSAICISPNITGPEGDQEGIPNVLKEAMAAEVPVVSTIHGGIPELVDHGISGLLTPEQDIDGMLQNILHLIEHPEVRTVMGKAGRKKVHDQFDIEKTGAQLVELYLNSL